MNSVTLTGRAARDVELRVTPNGNSVANGTIAVQKRFKNAQGEYDADFIRFVAWKKTGELMAEYIHQGDQFGISGELQQRNWEDQSGNKRETIEVNVNQFDFPPKPKNSGGSNQTDDDPFPSNGKPIDISDDDLPF